MYNCKLLRVVIVVQRDSVELHQDPGGDVTAQVGLEVPGTLKDVAEARDPVEYKICY